MVAEFAVSHDKNWNPLIAMEPVVRALPRSVSRSTVCGRSSI